MSKITLTYFGIAGRAEPSRIAFAVGGVEFEDKHVKGDSWKELKPTLKPYGQLPMLEVDGKQLFQQHAIEYYVGAITNTTPADPFEAAKVLEFQNGLDEIMKAVGPTFQLPDGEKAAAREKLFAEGGAANKPIKIANDIIEAKSGDYIVGDSPSFADFTLFGLIGGLRGGFLDGVKPSYIEDTFPVLHAWAKKFAAHPKVAPLYADATEGYKLGFKF